MKRLRLLAIVALALAITGCDQNDFTEDFPDPAAEGLPPYVSFDHTQLAAPTWVYSADRDAEGSRRTVPYPATVAPPTTTTLPFLRFRLPTALEEDVRVTFTLSGDAVYGVDYRLFALEQDPQGAWNWVERVPQNNQGTITIRYFLINPSLPAHAPGAVTGWSADLRIQPLPNPARTTPRSVRIAISNAQALSTGRQLGIGRLPGNRDRVATLTFAAAP